MEQFFQKIYKENEKGNLKMSVIPALKLGFTFKQFQGSLQTILKRQEIVCKSVYIAEKNVRGNYY